MSEYGLTAENLLLTLPPPLAQDPRMLALAQAIAQLLVHRREEIGQVAIYPNIGRLDHSLLDILAYDFKVDWWDSEYGLEEKRRTLQNSWQVHKTLGTKAAVVKAASAVYPNTEVQEWFEYGGKPYSFKLNVGLPEGVWDPARKKQLMQGLNYYKNLRSHLEAVEYHLPVVVLENLQAFYFTGLLVALRAQNRPGAAGLNLALGWAVENRQGAAFSRLLLHMGEQNRQRFTAALALRVGSAGQRESSRFLLEGFCWRFVQEKRQGLAVGAFRFAQRLKNQNRTRQGLTVRARVNAWGRNIIRLDGSRRLDGTWALDQHLHKGLCLAGTVFSARCENRQSHTLRLNGVEL